MGLGLGLRYKLDQFLRYSYLRRCGDYRAAIGGEVPVLSYVGWVGHKNIGDEALFFAFKDHLFKNELVVPNDDFSMLSAMARRSKKRLVVLGGGTLINVKPYLPPLQKARDEGCPYVIWGTGVADLEYWSKFPDATDRGLPDQWISVVKGAKYVGVRGPRSKAWLDSMGVKGVQIVGDPALSIPQVESRRPPNARPVLGVNLGSHDPVSGGGDRSFNSVAELVRGAKRNGFDVKYFSLHKIDHEIGLALQRELGNGCIEVLNQADDTQGLMYQLSGFDYVVGQRLHATILACAQGVPNLSLSYQPKCLDFLESISCERLAIKTEEIDPAGLVAKFSGLVESAREVRNDIERGRDKYRAIQASRAFYLSKSLGVGELHK